MLAHDCKYWFPQRSTLQTLISVIPDRQVQGLPVPLVAAASITCFVETPRRINVTHGSAQSLTQNYESFHSSTSSFFRPTMATAERYYLRDDPQRSFCARYFSKRDVPRSTQCDMPSCGIQGNSRSFYLTPCVIHFLTILLVRYLYLCASYHQFPPCALVRIPYLGTSFTSSASTLSFSLVDPNSCSHVLDLTFCLSWLKTISLFANVTNHFQ